jgi:LytS/YehU family sensor histidine kinase
LELSEALRAVNDSLLNEHNLESMNELRVRYETERHEAEKRLLQQENELATARLIRQRTVIAALVGGVLLVAVVVLLLLRAWRRRTAQRILELEHQALRAQMDPHFLFNALNTVPGLYHTHGVAQATDYVGHLGQLLRMILDSSARRAVSVREEVALLTHYLQVMAFRHPDRFTFTFDVDPAIDAEGSGLPPMLLQPLVENAVLHGVLKRDGGEVQVQFQLAGSELRCVVRDNGPGLERMPDLAPSVEPSGLRITHERIRLSDGRRSRGQGLILRTLQDEQGSSAGTEATFQLRVIELWDR